MRTHQIARVLTIVWVHRGVLATIILMDMDAFSLENLVPGAVALVFVFALLLREHFGKTEWHSPKVMALVAFAPILVVAWDHAWIDMVVIVMCIGLELLAPRQKRTFFTKESTHTGFFALTLVGIRWLLMAGGVMVALFSLTPSPIALIHTELPIWFQVIIMALALDFTAYFMHRAEHASPYFWRSHKHHHSIAEVSILTAVYRDHPLFVLRRMVVTAATFWLLHPTMEVIGWTFALSLPFNFFIHANVDFPRKGKFPWWAHIVATPNYHAWHHTKHARYDANLAAVFPIWDHLFGTYEAPRGDSSTWEFGLNAGEELEPRLSDQLLLPIRYARDWINTNVIRRRGASGNKGIAGEEIQLRPTGLEGNFQAGLLVDVPREMSGIEAVGDKS